MSPQIAPWMASRSRETRDRGDRMAATSPECFYPPIEDYAVIGDCRTAAIISREGSIDWLCLPDFSSPSIFARLLDRRVGGHFLVMPRDVFTVERRYIDDTPVLETIFKTDNGVVRLVDAFALVDGVETIQPMREILRIIEGVSGEVELEIRIDPRPNYGRTKPRLKDHGQLGWGYDWSNELLTLRSDIKLKPLDNALHAFAFIRAGDRFCLSLSYVKSDMGVLSPLGRHAENKVAYTSRWWRSWTDGCAYRGPYRKAVRRSALTLKLLGFALSGAIVAAPTASLPEAIKSNRNWDYRYCWLRDAGMTMQALVGLGFQDDARGFLSWLLHATRLSWPELQIMYDVYGRTRLREQELKHLEGYQGSQPVRIGNGAYGQSQLDVYGEVVFAAETYVNGGGTLEPVERRLLTGFGKVVCRKWREADHGIWEKRGAPRQHTFSKLMCWLALDRLLALNEKGALDLGSSAAEFRRERQAIADVIEQRGFNFRLGSYTGELDGERVDASLLLMPCIGYRPADDARVRSTYERIWQRLGRNGLLYRYEAGTDGQDDDAVSPPDSVEKPASIFSHPARARREGTFGICSFWAVHHLACRGDVVEAKRLFEHVLSFANDLGLFAEEIDPETGAALGNFPQAFTHVGLINAAMAIERAASDARMR